MSRTRKNNRNVQVRWHRGPGHLSLAFFNFFCYSNNDNNNNTWASVVHPFVSAGDDTHCYNTYLLWRFVRPTITADNDAIIRSVANFPGKSSGLPFIYLNHITWVLMSKFIFFIFIVQKLQNRRWYYDMTRPCLLPVNKSRITIYYFTLYGDS